MKSGILPLVLNLARNDGELTKSLMAWVKDQPCLIANLTAAKSPVRCPAAEASISSWNGASVRLPLMLYVRTGEKEHHFYRFDE